MVRHAESLIESNNNIITIHNNIMIHRRMNWQSATTKGASIIMGNVKAYQYRIVWSIIRYRSKNYHYKHSCH